MSVATGEAVKKDSLKGFVVLDMNYDQVELISGRRRKKY